MLKALVSATGLLIAGCTPHAQPAARTEVLAAIRNVERAQFAALAKGDLDAALAGYTADAVLVGPAMAPAAGSQEMKAVFARVLRDPALNVAIDEGSRRSWVSASGDQAATNYSSAYTHTDAASGKPVTDKLFSETIWAKQADGSWKMVSDINTVYPAGPAKPQP